MAKSKERQSVCNLILPIKVEALQKIAETMTSEDGKLTVGDVNGGRYSEAEVRALWGEQNEDGSYPAGSMNDAISRGLKTVPAVPAVHQPVLLLAAKRIGMTFAYVGQGAKSTKEPAEWNSTLPAWKQGYSLDPQGGRGQALKDVRRNVTDEAFIVKVGTYEYVIGDENESAFFKLNGSKGENNYGWNLIALKRAAFRGREKELANLVFQINNSVTTIRHTGDGTVGSEVVYLPNMLATAGHLVRDGKTLTYAQISKAIEAEDTKGIRFQRLESPIVGESVTQQQFFSAVKKVMNLKATADEKGVTAWERWVKAYKGNEENALEAIWRNIRVQTRNNVTTQYCFGLRNSVCDQPLAIVYGDNAKDQRLTVIIGLRCGDSTTAESKEAMNERLAASEAETPKAEKPKAEKPKVEKPKAEKKASKKRKPTKKVEPVAPVAEAEDIPAAEPELSEAEAAEAERGVEAELESEEIAEAEAEAVAAE